MENPPKKPFGLSQDRTAFTLRDLDKAKATIRDKDNAAPRIPPPKSIQLDHPRLAPPGMSGIKASRQLGLPMQPPKIERPPGPRQPGELAKTFKPLVQTPPGKSHERSR